ncbi:myosin light chain kinase 3 isoform X1 [Rana temporaria]|uniref:myosin light chain kinase 3 isoform X1 n=1 Tax=Rana temporaria TaxID=8407 RepID=UPI001AADA2AC|nr:myosin light chain kinase 3 isoform X1 [Rana temporaria]
MSKQESITSCLAKMYESKFDQSTGPGKSPVKPPGLANNMDNKLNLLNEKMDKLLHFQEDVMGKLETVSHGMDLLGKGMDKLSASHGPNPQSPKENIEPAVEERSFSELIRLLKMLHGESIIHQEKLDGLQKMMSTMDKVVAFVGNTLKNSKIVDFILKGTVPWRKEEEAKDDAEEKESKPKHVLASRGSQIDVQRATATPQKSSSSEGRRLSHKMAQCTSHHAKADSTDVQTLDIPQQPDSSHNAKPWTQKVAGELPGDKNAQTDSDARHKQPSLTPAADQSSKTEEPKQIVEEPGGDPDPLPQKMISATCPQSPEDHLQRKSTCVQTEEISNSGTRSVPEKEQKSDKNTPASARHKTQATSKDTKTSSATQTEDIQPEEPVPTQKIGHMDLKQAQNSDKGVKGGVKPNQTELVRKDCGPAPTPASSSVNKPPVDTRTALEDSSLHVIDDCPPPPAPFNHRIVSIKQAILSSCYTVCQHEVLGGGRFGQVHKCVEISTGLRLAAKIIKIKAPKDRDEVKNEINIMNQLNHVNLIQLYDAFECKNDLTLIMEYLDGGELFDRITDENYHLTELDAIMFTKQICEGIYYVHQQYILHLDLKPENILCINRTGNQIKIIDFGLARRYKPREKLKVNFGTPEFLAPEVVNYDFVSFPTDMWSVGVITYMLLSGLSPFLGESDAETMNYIVNCNWDFDSEAFDQVSEEAKDFISGLLLKEKSCRLSAGQCLKHEWLTNLPLKAKKYKVRLKSQIMLQKYMAQRKWKKHFYVVAAANRLRKFQLLSLKPS